MKQKAGQQPDVLEEIFLLEEKRRKLRFEYNLAALVADSIQVLGSDEFATDLAAFLAGDSREKDQHRKTLIALGRAVSCPEQAVRERTLTVLSVAAQHSIQEQNRGNIVLLVHGFSNWLEYEQEVLPGLAVVFKRIEELSGWLLQMSLWKESEKIVALLSRIHWGGLKKSSALRSHAGKCLANLATESIVEKLVDSYLHDEMERELCSGILQSLGRQSAGFLLKRCLGCSERRKRQALLPLVSTIAGDALPGLIEDSLQPQPPTEALLDVIAYVGESGEAALYPALQQYFNHEDKRVPHELVRCVAKLGGREMKERLTAGLVTSHEDLKITIIRLLAEHAGGDESVLSALCGCIEGNGSAPTNVSQGVLRAVVVALRGFPFRESIEVLGRLQRKYGNLPESDRLLLQIDRSLKMLHPQLRRDRQSAEDAQEIFFDSDPLHRQNARRKAAKMDEEVRKILGQGDSKGAGKFLYQQAQLAGKARDFILAEVLRDRILEVDPMALLEVVELGEWLEKQKKALVEPLQSETWSSLGGLLSPNELKALHKALRRQKYRKGDIIIHTGEADEVLYFLTSGSIGLNCLAGGDEHFLKRLMPGDVLGGAQFFAASVWTFSLRALTDVQVHCIGRDDFRLLAEKYPELEQKLHRYCAKYDNMIAALVKTTGDDRREFPRYPASRLIRNSLQDPYGARESREFHGELVNISRNGLSFTVKISSCENARLLLGREIVSVIQVGGDSITRCSGIVVGVRERNAVAKEYSVHVKLARRIDDLTISRIVTPD